MFQFKFKPTRCLSAFLLMMAPVRALGETDAPVTVRLSLETVERMALDRNPAIRAADDRARAAGHQAIQRLFPADPMVMLDRSGLAPGQLSGGYSMDMWMVEENFRFPGKSLVERGGDRAEARRMGSVADDQRRGILLEARRGFWDFYEREKVWEILRDAQKRWATLAREVQNRELTGQYLSLKAIRMQMETARATNRFIDSEREMGVAAAALDRVLSLPPGTRYEPPDEPALEPFLRDREALLRKTIEGNPRLAAMRNEVDKMKSARTSAYMEHLPDFFVRASAMKNIVGSGYSDYGFRVGVSVPLFFPFKQSQEAAKASDELDAARWDLKGSEDEALQRVEGAFTEALSDWRLVSLFEQGGLKTQTEKAWQSAQVAYRNESMPLADYVESYGIYLDTLSQYYRTKADYGRALAELDYEVGTFSAPTNVSSKAEKE